MKTAMPGDRLEVSVGEIFALRRWGRETSGYRFAVELPTGVERLAAERRPASGFGGSSEVLERFRCDRAGRFEIVLLEGRPWETETSLPSLHVTAG